MLPRSCSCNQKTQSLKMKKKIMELILRIQAKIKQRSLPRIQMSKSRIQKSQQERKEVADAAEV